MLIVIDLKCEAGHKSAYLQGPNWKICKTNFDHCNTLAGLVLLVYLYSSGFKTEDSVRIFGAIHIFLMSKMLLN